MSRPHLTVVTPPTVDAGQDAALRAAAEDAFARVLTMTADERVECLRHGYRASYPELVEIPRGWLGLLTEAVGAAARPLNLDMRDGPGVERDVLLRRAEEHAEHAAACALELAECLRRARTDPGF